MKHSIRYIQYNYYQGTGRGKSLMIVRGMEIREYSYSYKNADKLTLLTSNKKQWNAQFHPNHIGVARIYRD